MDCLPSQLGATTVGASQLLEAFYYGRAFAVTVNRRVGEALTDAIAEVSKVIAENPTRLQEFQVSLHLACWLVDST